MPRHADEIEVLQYAVAEAIWLRDLAGRGEPHQGFFEAPQADKDRFGAYARAAIAAMAKGSAADVRSKLAPNGVRVDRIRLEQEVLGALIFGGGRCAVAGVSEQHFRMDLHKEIFRAIPMTDEDNVSPVLIHEALKFNPDYRGLGAMAYLADLISYAPTEKGAKVAFMALDLCLNNPAEDGEVN